MPITTITSREFSTTVPKGKVIRTDPPNATLVGPDQVVTVVVSLGQLSDRHIVNPWPWNVFMYGGRGKR